MARVVILVALGLALVALLAWGVWKLTPVKKSNPSAASLILADLLNATNYEMRSFELGRWFVGQLRLQLRNGTSCADVDVGAIVAGVPKTNEVTRAELAKHLRALLARACTGPNTPLTNLNKYMRLLSPSSTNKLGGHRYPFYMNDRSVRQSLPPCGDACDFVYEDLVGDLLGGGLARAVVELVGGPRASV